MGIKWTAKLRVDFEMEEGAPQNLAETRLRTAVGEFQRNIETGLIGVGKTGVKRGSSKNRNRGAGTDCLVPERRFPPHWTRLRPVRTLSVEVDSGQF